MSAFEGERFDLNLEGETGETVDRSDVSHSEETLNDKDDFLPPTQGQLPIVVLIIGMAGKCDRCHSSM